MATPHQVRSHERKEGERPVGRETFAAWRRVGDGGGLGDHLVGWLLEYGKIIR